MTPLIQFLNFLLSALLEFPTFKVVFLKVHAFFHSIFFAVGKVDSEPYLLILLECWTLTSNNISKLM